MRTFELQLRCLCDRNRDGSFGSQSARKNMLVLFTQQLFEMGYLHMFANSLRQKHVLALLERWKQEGIAVGTIKNRMSALRWWAEKIGKDNLMHPSNAAYGIADRTYVTNVSKANAIQAVQIAKVDDPFTLASLRLQEQFGLRREESIKIKPRWADQGAVLRLKSSWTKGGKYREVPIKTAEQRAALDAAKALAGTKSLIPAHMRYIDQLNRFKAQCQKAGIHHVHGLRHSYAQCRYKELAGWACPVQGGPLSKQLTLAQKKADRVARLIISAELGHVRESITAQYLGR